MKPKTKVVESVPEKAEASFVLVTTDDVTAGLEGMAFDSALVKSAGFKGKADQTHMQPGEDRIIGLVGLGPKADVNAKSLRRAGAAVARNGKRLRHIAVTVPESDALGLSDGEAHQALAEGLILGAYRYTPYKSKVDGAGGSSRKARLRKVALVGDCSEATQSAVNRGVAIAAGVCLTRDLVNEPGGSLTPKAFARKAAAASRQAGLSVQVWTISDIRRERLGGLLGVNRGSERPPRFVQLSYEPETDGEQPAATVALVGKGITFDAGGLSIKTSKGMMTMKYDMAGAAAVIGAMSVIPKVAPNVSVRAYLPMTDNMLGGDATRPGDVLTIRNGKTIEVANTDAEGRLVLADALSLASEHQPDAIIDLATLTGACVIALGRSIAGLMGNNESWIAQVRQAAETVGERVWHLPLPADYEAQFDSPVADMKNIGTPQGGALTAGLILQKFVAEDIPWAHLDIAGPAYAEKANGEISKGATGFGVRTLVELVSSFVKPQPSNGSSNESSLSSSD